MRDAKRVMLTLQNPTATIKPYPSVTMTPKAMKLAGMPLVRKCDTLRYLLPVWLSSIMIAARAPGCQLRTSWKCRGGWMEGGKE